MNNFKKINAGQEDFGLGEYSLGIDVESLKKKFQEEQNKIMVNKDSRFLYLPNGKTRIRILPPYKKGSNEFFKDFLVHSINNKNIVCLRKRKYAPIKECPICFLVNKFFYASPEKSDNVIGALLRSRPRYYYNVVVREYKPDEENPNIDLTVNPTQVKILSTGSKLYEKIKDIILNTEYGDITNIFNGYDFVIVKILKRIESGKMIPNYDNSYPSKDSSPLNSDPKIMKEILNNMYDLEEIVNSSMITPAEMMENIYQYLQETMHEAALEFVKNKMSFSSQNKIFVPSSTGTIENKNLNSNLNTNSNPNQAPNNISEMVQNQIKKPSNVINNQKINNIKAEEDIEPNLLQEFSDIMLDKNKEDDDEGIPF